MNVIDDVLTLILSHVDIKSVLVCKHWRDIILKSSFVCKGCNKITHSFGKSLWYTHAMYTLPCHAFYDNIYISSNQGRKTYYRDNLSTIRQCRGICLDAVNMDGLNLMNIHKVYKTHEIYIAATNRHEPSVMQYIDQDDLTPELIKKISPRNRDFLKYIPKKYQSNDIINTSLKNNGMALAYVLVSITLNMCYTAIKQNGLALQFVPHDMIDKCIIKALKQNGNALMYVPDDLITQKICFRALDSSISAAKYVQPTYVYTFKSYKHNYGKYLYLKKNSFVHTM